MTEGAAPLVTCIIIFLNEERFLDEAIESVLTQDFDDFELLLVDDGSTDGSTAIAQYHSDKTPGRVRYLEHPGHANRGMSASRNLGLANALGRLVAFLDGDDIWRPDKLRRQVAIFEDHPETAMVCGATLYWNSWTEGADVEDREVQTGEVRRPGIKRQDVELDRLHPPGALVHRLYPLAKGATPSASGYMITRQLAREVGGFEESFRGAFEDQVFRAKVFLAAPVYVSSACFDQYRQHPGSCMQNARRTGALDRQRWRFFRWYARYARERYPNDAALRTAIDRTMREEFGWRKRFRFALLRLLSVLRRGARETHV